MHFRNWRGFAKYTRTLTFLQSNLFHQTYQTAMPQKITSFFQPLKTKRTSDDDCSLPTKKPCIQTKDSKENINVNKNVENNSQKLEKPIFDKNKKVLSGDFGSSWFQALEPEFSKPYFLHLKTFIANERLISTIYPPEAEVFSWTMFCNISKVKVIILGQDPYHGVNQAHGLAFSVKKGVDKPPSLINIFKEVKSDYPDFVIPSHGDLTGWAKQGVLLLNACLTVRAHNANSHSNKGWEQFTDAVIKYFNNNFNNRVFLLWGSYAQKKGSFINQKKHLVLKTVHPSPLSATRGFFGCAHFKKVNEYLKKNQLPIIDWTKLD